MRKWSFHVCHPRSGDCAMDGIRFNLATPWCFVTVGLFGGQVQKDGTEEWTWLDIDRDWPRRRDKR